METELFEYINNEVKIAQFSDRKDGFWDTLVPKISKPVSNAQLKQAAVQTEAIIFNGDKHDFIWQFDSQVQRLKSLLRRVWINQKRDELILACKRRFTQVSEILTESEKFNKSASILMSDEAIANFGKCDCKILRDQEAARWDTENNQWKRIPFMLDSNPIAVLNPAYFTAPFEDMIFATGSEIEFVIPHHLLAGTDAFSWLAEIKALDENQAPLSEKSKSVCLFAKLSYSLNEVNPSAGGVFRFRRLDPTLKHNP